MSMPSLSSSPWIRGAPHKGFSRHILRIRFRTSRGTVGLPRWPRRIFQVQKSRKLLRCHARTVPGRTIASTERQSLQTRDRQTQKRRSTGVNLGRFLVERCSTPSWWRRARFSSSRAARERKIKHKLKRSFVSEMGIGGENYQRSIIPVRSDISGFSRGTLEFRAIQNLDSLTRSWRERALANPIATEPPGQDYLRNGDLSLVIEHPRRTNASKLDGKDPIFVASIATVGLH